MTVETSSAAASASPARSLRGLASPKGQRRPGEYSACVSRVHARTGADPAAVYLANRARTGGKRARDALAERYTPLIWSICRRYRLSVAGAGDVDHSVWVHLADHLDDLRDPAVIPGPAATATRRERGRVARATCRPDAVGYVPEAEMLPDQQPATADQDLPLAGRHAAPREAFAALPPSGQQLIAMLTADPPVPHTEDTARLGIPVGRIGPTRRRSPGKLRRPPAIAALIPAGSSAAGRAVHVTPGFQPDPVAGPVPGHSPARTPPGTRFRPSGSECRGTAEPGGKPGGAASKPSKLASAGEPQ